MVVNKPKPGTESAWWEGRKELGSRRISFPRAPKGKQEMGDKLGVWDEQMNTAIYKTDKQKDFHCIV